jgi:uncharacterized protein (AIM24 family)
MKEQLLGTTLPVLSLSLDAGESVVAEAGEFSWMTDSIQMSTGMGGGGVGGHGVMGALKRAAGGSSLFLSTYTAKDAAGVIAFASKLPGSILGVDISPQSGGGRRPGAGTAQRGGGNSTARGREQHSEYLVHRHGFLAGTPEIQISAGFQQSFSAGVFAGEGFILQRVGGHGRAWIELAGEVVTYNLAPGESLRVHPGHVGMFTASVSFQVMRVPGITNRYFGGDEHHFAVLSGPGSVWLQSMPMPVLAASLAPYLPQAQDQQGQVPSGGGRRPGAGAERGGGNSTARGRDIQSAAEAGVGGGIIGDLLH